MMYFLPSRILLASLVTAMILRCDARQDLDIENGGKLPTRTPPKAKPDKQCFTVGNYVVYFCLPVGFAAYGALADALFGGPGGAVAGFIKGVTLGTGLTIPLHYLRDYWVWVNSTKDNVSKNDGQASV